MTRIFNVGLLCLLCLLLAGCVSISEPPQIELNVGVTTPFTVTATNWFGLSEVKSPEIVSTCPVLEVGNTSVSGDKFSTTLLAKEYSVSLANCLTFRYADGEQLLSTKFQLNRPMEFSNIVYNSAPSLDQEEPIEFGISILDSDVAYNYMIKSTTSSQGVTIGETSPSEFSLEGETARYSSNSNPPSSIVIHDNGDSSRSVKVTFNLFISSEGELYKVDSRDINILSS